MFNRIIKRFYLDEFKVNFFGCYDFLLCKFQNPKISKLGFKPDFSF
jgi:hypothetical protein